ncbi:MAG: hypothetical protein JWQ70_1130 [Aeromicrobium sp.]|jgi:hypothetical protein|nr:hypothetical protein [Aeromicrobium sp.]
MTTTTATTGWTTKNKVGLGLAVFYGIVNIPSFLEAADPGEDGPPLSIMIVCSILGVVAAVAGVIAWRNRSRAAARLTAASVIIITLTSLPAFFVDVPAAVKILVAVSVLLTVAIVILMFSPAKRSSAVQG